MFHIRPTTAITGTVNWIDARRNEERRTGQHVVGALIIDLAEPRSDPPSW
jgi:hypothetical protein